MLAALIEADARWWTAQAAVAKLARRMAIEEDDAAPSKAGRRPLDRPQLSIPPRRRLEPRERRSAGTNGNQSETPMKKIITTVLTVGALTAVPAPTANASAWHSCSAYHSGYPVAYNLQPAAR